MTHDEVLRDLVRNMEQTSDECADVGRIYLIDGRSMLATLRAIVDGAPDFKSNREAGEERGKRVSEGAPFSVVAHHCEWKVRK